MSGLVARWRTVAVGFVLVLALALASGWAIRARGDLRDEQDLVAARQGALAAASSAVPQLLTYSSADLDTQLAAALDLLTERFTPEYEQLQRELIAPSLEQGGVSTTATLERIGVVEEGAQEVTLLVMLSQVTSGPQARDAEPIATRATVRMRLDGDTWLVDALTPV